MAQLDLSAGLKAKDSGGIDLSSGLVKKDSSDSSTEPQKLGFFRSLASDLVSMAKGSASLLPPVQAYHGVKKGVEEYQSLTSTGKTTEQLRSDEQAKEGYGWGYRHISTPLAEGIGVNVQEMEKSAKEGDVAGVYGHAAAVPVVMVGTGLAAKAAGGLSKVGKLRASIKPKVVPLAGEQVPVLVGEASPDTVGGRVQTELKRAGAGEKSFTDFARTQQARVKQVIRNIAQKTSGLIGPMKDEPGAALSDAADATFAQAKPMYEALDSSLATVPDSMANVSKVTEQAIARAEKLGVTLTEGAGEQIVIDGRKFTPESDPVAWKNMQDQGMIPKTAGQPISTYMKVRSALLKMQRSTPDAALRNHIAGEVSAMNANMETALKGTPLFEDWIEANRLWSKGYAIRDVADAVRKSTKGTPAAEQASSLSKKPTQVRGPELVRRLNDLKQNGVLQKAFTPEEAGNLRQAADILDRASASAGREFGFGYSAHSTIWRNLIKLPAYPLVKAMTSIDGVSALKEAAAASSPTQFDAALTRFTTLATAGAVAGTQVKNRKEALDLLSAPAQ